MPHILILTVGGSTDPLVHCITRIRPDRVVFLCSEGSVGCVDKVLRQVPLPGFSADRDQVILQQRLRLNQGEEVVNALDRLDHVYLQARDLFSRLRLDAPGARLTADYTGGTKTMSAGLALAAIDDGDIELLVTTTDQRKPGETAITGHSTPIPVAQGRVQARRLLDTDLPPLLERFDYSAALGAVTRVRRIALPDAEAAQLLRLENLLIAFEAWDRFDHLHAVSLLNASSGDTRVTEYLLLLKRVIHSRRQLDQQAAVENWPAMPGHGLEAVEDLLLNAARRGAQQRYDDAVGRLYRATELAAQLLLKQGFDQLSGAIAIERLPPELQLLYTEKHQRKGGDGQLQLGLAESFDLLASLGHPVGALWLQRRSFLTDQLKHRNNSLFAHGFQPIGYAGWRELSAALGEFLKEAIDLTNTSGRSARGATRQLPCCLADLA